MRAILGANRAFVIDVERDRFLSVCEIDLVIASSRLRNWLADGDCGQPRPLEGLENESTELFRVDGLQQTELSVYECEHSRNIGSTIWEEGGGV